MALASGVAGGLDGGLAGDQACGAVLTVPGLAEHLLAVERASCADRSSRSVAALSGGLRCAKCAVDTMQHGFLHREFNEAFFDGFFVSLATARACVRERITLSRNCNTWRRSAKFSVRG